MASDPAAHLAALPSIVSIPSRNVVLTASQLPRQLTSLVGRELELAALRALLASDEVRLLTLVGPGGIGKTRLAIRLAEELAASFADGVAFIALAGVHDPALMLPTIYRALGGRDAGNDIGRERLQQLLDDRALLLLIDNVEHLVAASAALSDLLTTCPRLKMLVTSRAALRLSAEHEYLVPPLSLPDLAVQTTAEDLLQADAVSLFVQRARAARLDFAPSREELAAVGAICHRLDGLPLAIELAAARVTHLSANALLERFDRPGGGRLPLLTGGPRDQPARHQTLRDTIAWSYDLLDPGERAMFQRLAVFDDGFPIAAAEWVHPSPDTLDLIGSLVAKSLVRYDGDRASAPRYRMFETIHEFAREQLAASGQEVDARRRHAAWALALAEHAGPRTKGPDGACWLETLECEHASLRAALLWLAERQESDLVARLVGALWPFWEEHAHYAEGRRWLERALELGRDVPTQARLQLLTGAGTMARHQADFPQALVRHEQALALARELSDREAEALAHNSIGAELMDLGDFDNARAQFEACMVLARDVGAPHLVIRARHNIAQIQRVELDSAAALRSLEEVLALAQAHQMSWLLPYLINGIALTAADLGDFDRAVVMFHENIRQSVAKGSLGHVIDGIEGVARVAAATGHMTRAARLYAAGEALREKLTFPISPTEIAYAEPVMQRLRDALGADGFAVAWADGRAMTQAAAIDMALAVRAETCAQGESTRALHRGNGHGLTSREFEILRLIAAGQSNREIAEELFISYATVARHVANLFGKLGVDSRSKATVYAHQHGIS